MYERVYERVCAVARCMRGYVRGCVYFKLYVKVCRGWLACTCRDGGVNVERGLGHLYPGHREHHPTDLPITPSMDGWMDGWKDGWKERWVDGKMDGLVN